ncbi:stage III sporulation protein AD [Turicibacter sanguinis]|uniref:Stage III sporulation protein AD n=2 Tax=Turicibacter sanguinis TaxID=154288 RepID=A0A9X4XFL4_9FIRM|nr:MULTISPECIES: hypothetical protein [Turicibacter]EFF65032.1 putative stage III sporulation protein AD [Turicibacter sanguinis PC909]MCU7196706.1 stage III sporulation protein AD [Turicibacter sanguinis]MDB8553288.1 stage III sporulation protein AD [Turicibacter sanguinis]MDB8570213.1 stage III sporulation protein AD [Turicibacter sanguinis]MDB8572965.1 stage III sporulation protein AD [Turicibacter sanguinis]
MLLEEVNPKYAKGFSLVLLTFFFMVALQILSKMIGDLTAVFLNFNIEQQYVTIIIRLIGIVYYAEFVNFLLTEAKLGNVGKMFEYIVKLYLIGYSLPMIITLFELILSIL